MCVFPDGVSNFTLQMFLILFQIFPISGKDLQWESICNLVFPDHLVLTHLRSLQFLHSLLRWDQFGLQRSNFMLHGHHHWSQLLCVLLCLLEGSQSFVKDMSAAMFQRKLSWSDEHCCSVTFRASHAKQHQVNLLHLILQVLFLLALCETPSQLSQFPLHWLPVLVPLGSFLLQTSVVLDLVLTDSFCGIRGEYVDSRQPTRPTTNPSTSKLHLSTERWL